MIDFKRLIDFYGEAGARFAFEDMCADLLAEEYPGILQIRPNPGDNGIDCIRFDPSDGKAIVYQCKYFPNDIEKSQKEQIRGSYKAVCKSLGEFLKQWFLILPRNMDNNELNWFQKWKAKQDGIDINLFGEPQLRSLLAKHPSIRDCYFQSGNAEIFKKIILSQAEVITELKKGFDKINASPELSLMFFASDSTLSEEVIISKKKCEKYKTFEPKSETEIERICKLYDGTLKEDRIHKIMKCYNEKLPPYMNKLNEEKEAVAAHENPNFIMFAVLNKGEAPAIDVNVRISFPSALFVCTCSELSELEKRLPIPPIDPEKIIRKIAESMIIPKSPKLSYDVLGFDPEASIASALAVPISPAFDLFGNVSLYPMDVNSHEKTAEFSIGKVMHDGHYSYPDNGLLIAPLEAGVFDISYSIIADNIRNTVEGVLRIKTSEEIESIEKWDPCDE